MEGYNEEWLEEALYAQAKFEDLKAEIQKRGTCYKDSTPKKKGTSLSIIFFHSFVFLLLLKLLVANASSNM